MELSIETSINFDNLIKENLKYRFESELKLAYDEERISQLNKIIKNINGEKVENIPTNVKEDFNAFFDKISNDVYKKQWIRMPDMNKIVKIKEYVKSLDMDKKEKMSLEKKLLDKLKEGKLEKVEYDNKSCKIIKIKNI